MRTSIIQQVLNIYELDYSKILPVQTGYRNSIYPIELVNGQYVNLLLYKNEVGILDKIKNANIVSGILYGAGLPVRCLRDQRTIILSTESVKIYGCLYNYLPGSTIAWEAYTKAHIKLIGKALATLHKSMKDIPKIDAVLASNVTQNSYKQMQVYFNQNGVESAMKRKLKIRINIKYLKEITETIVQDTSRQQILHMDFVRGNILFDKPKADYNLAEKNVAISGILDFEKVSYGNPLHDIARTMAFLLVDCKYKSASKISKYFLRSGYIKRGQTEIPNIDLLDRFIFYYLAYDLYKFMLHNPYEDLDQNQHFIRTRDILLKTKVLDLA